MSEANSTNTPSVSSSGFPSALPWVVLYDSQDNARRALGELLLDAGFAVEECTEPSEVVAAAQSGRRIHVVLIELKAGRWLAGAVRQYQPDVRVLFMSGLESLPDGVVGELVKKPVDFDGLLGSLGCQADETARRAG